MEKRGRIPPEARTAAISAFFDEELKKISDEIESAKSIPIGVNANGTVTRKEQMILHLEQRQTELEHIREFVLGIFNNTPQVTQTPEIRGFFKGKLDAIGIEIERTKSHPHEVTIQGGIVKGREQELEHLTTIQADMFRIGNHVLSLLGEPLLVNKKDSATTRMVSSSSLSLRVEDLSNQSS